MSWSLSIARRIRLLALELRQRIARVLLGRLERAAERKARSAGLIWNLAYFLYLTKRLVQAVPSASPRRWRALAPWSREVTTQWLLKLQRWADFEVGQAYQPYLIHRRNNRVRPREAVRMRRIARDFSYRPLVSILVPVYEARPEWIERLVRSVLDQAYDRWELILVDDGSTDPDTQAALSRCAERDEHIVVERLRKNRGVCFATNRAAKLAHGEFLAFVDHDDELTPDALWCMVEQLQRRPELDVLYSDEEYVPENGPPYPSFKPDLSPELLLAYNYVCHLVVVRRSIFDEVGRLRLGTEGAQDYDLVLRLLERTDRIAHVPRVLYRWHIVPESFSRTVDEAGRLSANRELEAVTQKVVQDRLDRLSAPARCHVVRGWSRPEFLPVDRGKVSILICTRDHPRLLERAVRSIESQTLYPNYEIVIIDNGSESRSARRLLDRLSAKHRVLRLPSRPEDFNFSALNNEGARQVDGEFLLFLNDDTEVLRPGWLCAMVGYANLPKVGAVGARLLYPNRRIQHAGIVVGAMGWGPWHGMVGVPADDDGYGGYLTVSHNCLAVTGACLLTPRELFFAVGGFDAERLAVSFNDVDYCLRLHRAGYRCVFAPQAELTHFESQSRDPRIDPREAAHMRSRYPDVRDPFWNPNLSRETPHFVPCSRRRVRRIDRETPPEILVVGRPSNAGDPWPHWEDLLRESERRGSGRFTAIAIDDDRWREEVREQLASGSFDVLLATGVEARSAIEQAAAFGVPSIWNLPGQLLASRATPEDAFEFVRVARAMATPYQVVFDNLFAKAWACCGVPRETYLTVEGTAFSPPLQVDRRQEIRQRIRKEWRVADDAVLVIGAAPWREGGWETVLDAYSALDQATRHRLAIVLVVLDDPGFARMDRLRRRMRGAKIDVRIDRQPSRLDEYMCAADGFLAHATTDHRPHTLLRALRFGLPTVGAERLVQSDLLYPDRTGLTFRPFDAGSLARALRRWVREPETLRRHAWGARYWLDSRSHPDRVLETWGSLFEEASELRRAGRRSRRLRRDRIEASAMPDSIPIDRFDGSEPAVGGSDAKDTGSPVASGSHSWDPMRSREDVGNPSPSRVEAPFGGT